MIPTITLITQALEHLTKTPAWLALGQLPQLLGDLAVVGLLAPVAIHAPADIHQATSMTLA